MPSIHAWRSLAIAGICAGSAFAQTWWKPLAKDNHSWQWQIGSVPAAGALLDVDMYDVDLEGIPAATISAMHAKGIKAVCYFSAGTYEGWRSDWGKFFPFIAGEDYQGTEKPFLGKMADWNERWLDVREIDLLKPIMTARLKAAKEKGCDAVEPDNMDAYSNASEVKAPGGISAAQQLAYNRAIASWAHEQGLSVALKNDMGQLDSLVGDFDWALNEQCYQYGECGGYAGSFLKAGKAVFGVEYQGDSASFCPKARQAHMSWLKKKLDLGPYREACNEGRTAGTGIDPTPARTARGGRNRPDGKGLAEGIRALRAPGEDWVDGNGRHLPVTR
jgi:hypothetical protein